MSPPPLAPASCGCACYARRRGGGEGTGPCGRLIWHHARPGQEEDGAQLAAEAAAAITHHVLDRPSVQGRAVQGRVYVQPQWVFDCVNANALLDTGPYGPGRPLPPHLSPFVDGSEGYVPPERVGVARPTAAEDEAPTAGKGTDMPAAVDEEDEEDEEAEEDEGEGEEMDEDGLRFARELEVRLRPLKAPLGALGWRPGLTAAPTALQAERLGTAPTTTVAPRKRAATAEAERKKMQLMLMPKKDRRLFDRMQFGIKRKAEKAGKLAAKRSKLDAEARARARGAEAEAPSPKPLQSPKQRQPKDRAHRGTGPRDRDALTRTRKREAAVPVRGKEQRGAGARVPKAGRKAAKSP